MPRPCKHRCIHLDPNYIYFKPQGIPMKELAEIFLALEEAQALHLADVEELNATQAAQRMGISRHTFGRILRKARRTLSTALLNGRALRIEKRENSV